MTPAQPRLGADHVVHLVQLWLLVPRELPGRDRLAQLALERRAGTAHLRHARIEETQRRAARGLRLIQGDVGLLDRILGAEAIARPQRRPDTAADVHMIAKRTGRRPHDLQAERLSLRGGRPRLWGEILQQHHELIPAHARDRVAVAHLSGEALGHLLPQRVSNGMAHRLVDALEVLEPEQQRRAVAGRARARGDRLTEPVLQQLAVRQPRQLPEEGEIPDALLELPAVSDIELAPHDERPEAFRRRSVTIPTAANPSPNNASVENSGTVGGGGRTAV